MTLALELPLAIEVGIVGVLFAFTTWVVAHIVPQWLSARFAGLRLTLTEVTGMWMRHAHLSRIVGAAVRLRRAGISEETATLEIHDLAGGDVGAVADAMILAKEKGHAATWQDLVVCDLAGRDVLAIVRAGVDPSRVVGAKEFLGRFNKNA